MKSGRFSIGLALLAAGMLLFLAFCIWGLTQAWKMGGSTHMSIHGWIAMFLAAGLTLGLGGGLMWLAFYSANRGYDDDQSGQP